MRGFTALLPALLVLTVLSPRSVGAQDPDPADGPVFVSYDVEPVLQNQGEVGHVMRRAYPSGYRDTGLDVTTLLWIYVGRDGTVGGSEVLKSSGYAVFDRAAEEVVDAMVFEPAQSGGEPVAVWVQKAVHFKSGESGRFLEGPALLADDVVQARDSARNSKDDDEQ